MSWWAKNIFKIFCYFKYIKKKKLLQRNVINARFLVIAFKQCEKDHPTNRIILNCSHRPNIYSNSKSVSVYPNHWRFLIHVKLLNITQCKLKISPTSCWLFKTSVNYTFGFKINTLQMLLTGLSIMIIRPKNYMINERTINSQSWSLLNRSN